jgi:hypothetical protein
MVSLRASVGDVGPDSTPLSAHAANRIEKTSELPSEPEHLMVMPKTSVDLSPFVSDACYPSARAASMKAVGRRLSGM